MKIRDPKNMTEEEVEWMWAVYEDMDGAISEQFGSWNSEVEPIPRDEMIELGMVFIGHSPAIYHTRD